MWKSLMGSFFYLAIRLVLSYDASNVLTLYAKRQNFTNMDILYKMGIEILCWLIFTKTPLSQNA